MIGFAEVGKKGTSFADELHKGSLGGGVAVVGLEVGGQIADSLGEDGDLDFNASGVFLGFAILLDEILLLFFVEHVRFSFRLLNIPNDESPKRI